jgi:hybrid polyketide synthase/nonribosomal peptide synthetase ACE1
MYRTGDIGHLQEDGAMVFHSRMASDTQIKIRGLRIELSDIESNIISAAGGALREAIVTLREGDPGFLVAHVVFAQQHDVTDKEAFLDNLLSNLQIPQYMIPAAAIPLDKLPLTNHSKVDRQALKTMDLPARTRSRQNNKELTETMVQLQRIWRDVLSSNKGLEFDITPSTSFFLVGGNSLLVLRLQSRIREVFNVVIRLVDLLGANALGQMARKIEESSSVDPINWEEETAPPAIPTFLKNGSKVSGGQKKTKSVLVTGGTGFLARYLLPQLAASSDIGTIHVVAVRDKISESPRKLPSSNKIVSHGGDLSSPLLGLSEEEFRDLASQVDVILHMGAVRSFWDNYHVLRPSNVHSTRELVKLAASRQIPIHYISTVGVLPRDGAMDAVSAATHVPSADGNNGYVATRWASERLLERSAADLGLPTTIYRFLPSAQKPSPKEDLEEFVRFVDVSKTMPDMSGWEGRMDMIPAEEAAQWLSKSILQQIKSKPVAATQFLHYESPIHVNVAELRTYLEEQRGDRGLQTMPGLRWIGRIKELGFGYFLASQEATIGGRAGGEGAFESRR